ncbi:MAG: hypothetical protein GXP31_08065 [Kiritimatiellaeota bacterium]|nr:hypothetical protein [Kiritimatiellota bacterium]
MKCLHARLPRICSAVWLASVAVCAAGETVRLGPDQRTCPRPSVPPLNTPRESIPDADVADPGLRLAPRIAHRWVVPPGQGFQVRLSAAAATPGGGKVVLTVWDWELRPVYSCSWSVPCTATLDFRVSGNGTYLLTLDRMGGDRATARLVRSFSVCPDNADKRADWWNNRQFFLGTCAFPERMHWRNAFGPRYPGDMTPRQAAELEAMLSGRLGLQVVRLLATPNSERAVDLYEKHGLRLFAKVAQAAKLGSPLLPQYEHVTEGRWRYPMPESICRAHFAAVARRFGSKAVFFEIGNESDNKDFWRGSVDEFIAVARWAAEEFSRHAPGVPVCAAGWTFIEPDRTRRFVRAFRNLFPWTSIHAHGDFRQCVRQLDRFEELLREVGARNKPKIDTEMGFCHWRLDMDAVSAGHAARKILFHWARGYRGVVAYRLRDQGGPRLAGEARGMWGLLDHDFCPRFQFGVLAALIRHFAGYRFEKTLAAGPDYYAYVFVRESRRLVTVFHADIDWTRRNLGVLRTNAGRARRIDPMGNESNVVQPATIALEAGVYPAIVQLEDGDVIEWRPPVR